MKYIIDEEELLDLIDQYDYNEPNIKDFLKSKTPVEEIARGEVGFMVNGYTIDGKLLSDIYDKTLSKNVYKQVIFYIQKENQ